MSVDPEERARRRRRDVLEAVLKAADAGRAISIPDLQKAVAWGGEITKHGLIWIVSGLEDQGYVARRWGPELSTEMTSGRKSFVIPLSRAYAERTGR